MNSLACNFHLFACCIQPAPAIVGVAMAHTSKSLTFANVCVLSCHQWQAE